MVGFVFELDEQGLEFVWWGDKAEMTFGLWLISSGKIGISSHKWGKFIHVTKLFTYGTILFLRQTFFL